MIALNVREEGYWDFKNVKISGIHKLAKYPAIMIPPMQHEILEFLVKENNTYKSMLDPFHGSGVTLVEGVDVGLEVSGIDINPYAHLITKVKLSDINSYNIEEAVESLIDEIKGQKTFLIHDFKNIHKWFREDIITDLSRIRFVILHEVNNIIRNYFWLCFGEIVKKYSNTRTSTFKLHIKKEDKIASLDNNVIEDFFKKVRSDYNLLTQSSCAKLYCADSIKQMKLMKEGSFDVICTSPPYGDNGTTVTYGQFSSLQLFWLDVCDIGGSTSAIENYSRIDTMSMGGNANSNKIQYDYVHFDKFIEKINPSKIKKSYKFIADYEKAFEEMTRVLKPGGSMVLTLANRRIDNQEFPLIETTIELAQHLGLTKACELNREIQFKRMPIKVSNIANHGAVKSMSKETTLIFKKELF